MKQVKVAVVGAGYFGEYHSRVFSENRLAELTSIVDVRRERARRMAEKYNVKSYYTSLEEMLEKEDIDAVSVATPEFHHMDPVIAAAEDGKHVFVEKPIAHTLSDAEAMIKATKKVKFMVGYLLRFDPRYAEGKRLISNGEIGEILSAWARRAGKKIVAERVGSWSNPLFYMAVHDIDLLNWYIESEAERVYAEARFNSLRDKGVPDVIFSLIRYKNGVTVSLETNWSRPATWKYPLESRLHVSGTKGVAYIDIFDQGLKVYTDDEQFTPDTIHWPVTNNRIIGALREEMNHFLECIIFDQQPMVTGKDGLDSLKVALAIIESYEKRKVIQL